MVAQRLEACRVRAGVERPDILFGINPRLAEPIGRDQMARRRGRIGKAERFAFDILQRLEARSRPGGDRRKIAAGLAVRAREGRHGVRARNFVRQDVTESAEIR
jgi:hypothetical protein